MKDTPILSIIVPTKNRYYYLWFLVEYFNAITDSSIELIIQDNSDDIEEHRAFYEKIRDLNDSRIKYNYVHESLSVIENSDRALYNATGDYVCFIGDDDIFSKTILNFISEIKEKDIDAVFPLNSSYSWPDIHSRLYGDKLSGKFTQTNITGEIVKETPKKLLDKVLKLGGTDIINLPRVYHGIVKLSVLKKIYERTGSFFPGPSPDMANAVALCNYVNRFIIIDIPFVVSGHSSKSTGGQGAAGKHFGEIRNIKHLPSDTADKWTPEVPFYWSGYTIYAESVIQALKRLGLSDELKTLNFNYLYATCLVFDVPFKDRIVKTMKENQSISKLTILFNYCLIWAKRIRFHLSANLQYILPEKNTKRIFKKQNIQEVAELNDKQILEFYNKNGKQYLNNNLPKF